MTIIAVRDGIMAADTAYFMQHIVVGFHPKIHRIKGHLVGSCGDDASSLKFIEWYARHVEDPTTAREQLPDNDFAAIAINPDGDILEYLAHCGASVIKNEFFAIGVGFQVAYGAFHMGASAERAVRAAIDLCAWCGGGIQVERLHP